MTDLISKLKYEHNILIDALENIKKLGINSQEAQNKLLSVKTLLLNHLKKEDTELYIVLRKEAETNYELLKILDLFAKDMEEISKFAFLFFSKYFHGDTTNSFSDDFDKLFTAIEVRIKKEENVLFSEYLKIINNTTIKLKE